MNDAERKYYLLREIALETKVSLTDAIKIIDLTWSAVLISEKEKDAIRREAFNEYLKETK